MEPQFTWTFPESHQLDTVQDAIKKKKKRKEPLQNRKGNAHITSVCESLAPCFWERTEKECWRYNPLRFPHSTLRIAISYLMERILRKEHCFWFAHTEHPSPSCSLGQSCFPSLESLSGSYICKGSEFISGLNFKYRRPFYLFIWVIFFYSFSPTAPSGELPLETSVTAQSVLS